VALIELNKIFVEVSPHCRALFSQREFPVVDMYITNSSETNRFKQLLQNFDWKIVDPIKPMKSACYGIFIMSDLWVIVTEQSIVGSTGV